MGFINPDRIWVKLKYVRHYNESSSSLADGIHVFRANSVYDPDATGTGGQPTGFDQWTAIYKRFYVAASKIKCYAINMDDDPVMFALFPSTTEETTASIAGMHFGEEKYSRQKLIPQTGMDKPIIIKNYNTTGKITGRPQKDSAYWHTDSGNPQLPWYWHVYYQNMNGNVNYHVVYRVELTYYVLMAQQDLTLADA